ncbi:acyl-CoA dehydrogenase [Labrys monachus]|uniref:Butyryl-CoA dehydrogenase n=1 Tax=Labrys monachus TaxID=217067 RepID=A0ABU0FAR2_9HYPH|nr:acyl-CoA dehydrogenase [Labrys monachus]MDQ0391707.1 butyryl-CoA dehydrogenase [Labrys monachus]
MTYQAPVADIAFALRHVADLDSLQQEGLYPEATPDVAAAVLEEAGRFASERIAPLNRDGDRVGARLEGHGVVTAPGWREAYRDWSAAGWNGLAAPASFGGQGLPLLLNAACLEMWNAASMAFGLGPLLTMGAVEALGSHGSPALRAAYLGKLVSGEWMGTMNLTEPQAGSDLGALRSRAERRDDGSYRIFGQKIFITYGDHDLTPNIVHLVLARLPNAPAGTRGISLFLVPKYLLDAEGRPDRRNDVLCAGLEHKLGIHGSPTCTMVFGDKEGAVGYLVGEEHRGLACMFTMMNNARLAVGLQGVAIAERAYQQALAYARERRQGRSAGWREGGMSPIIDHPDVRRMLMEMRAKTVAARGLCYQLAEALDRSRRSEDPARREDAQNLAALLTPVAKAFATDIGNEVASLGIQVHGGTGFIEETGAAQHFRDARIAAIYEGTNGIQAIDLVTRKVPLGDGRVMAGFIAGLRNSLEPMAGTPRFAGLAPLLLQPVDALERATAFVLAALRDRPADALAGAAPYLRLCAVAAGGVVLAREAMAAAAIDPHDPAHRRRIDTLHFHATQIAPPAAALATGIMRDHADAGLETVF